MKVVILAGGVGSRLSEETDVRPKPMVEIGHRPILWHIMKHYAQYGFNEFVLCLGYKSDYVKRYFNDALALSANMTIDFASGHDRGPRCGPRRLEGHARRHRPAHRDRRAPATCPAVPRRRAVHADLRRRRCRRRPRGTRQFHESHGRLATVTAVHPTARFGQLQIDGELVSRFDEKPQMSEGWINGGYFVLEPGIFDHIPGDVDWAKEPLESIASSGSWRRSSTRASGSAWTPSGTRSTSTPCGTRVPHRGRSGPEPGRPTRTRRTCTKRS